LARPRSSPTIPKTRAEGRGQEVKGKAQQAKGEVQGALGDDI